MAPVIPKKPRGIVFDLDGTLIDSRKDIARAANEMLSSFGQKPLSLETISSFVGDGSRRLVSRALAARGISTEAAQLDRGLQLFLDAYSRDPTGQTTFMPGAREAMDALSYLPLALCTNKTRSTTELVLESLGVQGYFSAIVCGDDFEHHKPHPFPLEHIATSLQVAPEELVMVGDGPQDIECGHAVGAYTVGIRGGVLPLERLVAASPNTLLDSMHDLPPLVQQLGNEAPEP